MVIEDLIKKVLEYNPDEVERIKRAYEFASEMHKGQYRQSGEEYIIHPLNVAYILAEIHADGDTLCAGLLHDTLEDTQTTKEEISSLFGENVANLVDGVTNFNKTNFSSKKDEDAANARKIISGLTSDVRIVIIKLADRLHNMRTLMYKSKEKQKEKAIETLEIFVPIAYYLGINNIKSELEDLCFMYLMEEKYKKSKEIREKLILDSNGYLEEMLYKIRELLNNKEIPNEIKVRIKNIYGVYRRIIRKDRDPHDLIAIKIMLEEIEKCYSTLGLIHSIYHPINSKFKDYICSPKNNLYQSLHTTVMGEQSQIVQIQIRTKEMDQIASYGLPIYWDLYRKDGRIFMQDKIAENKGFLDSIIEMNEMYHNDKTFVKEVKRELFADKIEVYTATGDRITLPLGSTPIDFAYKIHTELGNMIVQAIVNGEEVPFNYQLKDKDRIIIITDELAKGPQKEWINMVRTSHARRRIREFSKRQ